ncbi:pleckstrin homology domain-containing family A member 1 isoform X3 [Hydra vulgaris]|uniref:Pleckstrin homology domain-containing family A member 1 isoform X3 n=1 Tax=Hydra vulgaris TaxID=6087 RepID=A0ABM4CIH6_HYDVU
MLPSGGGVQLPRKEGDLLKYGSLLSGWSPRFFKLERSYLHYYKNKYTHLPTATITRGEISCVKPSTAFPDRKNVFEIVQTKGIVWYCQTSTPEEMRSWIEALTSQSSTLSSQRPSSLSPPSSKYSPVPDFSMLNNNNTNQYYDNQLNIPFGGFCNSQPADVYFSHEHEHASAPPPYSFINADLVSSDVNTCPPPYQPPM